MQVSVTFRNINPSDSLKEYASEKLSRIDKYLDNPAEANIVLSIEKFRHIAEVNIVGDGLKVNGQEETSDLYSAIDMVVDKLEKQVKKAKQKFRKRRSSVRSKPSNYKSEALSPETSKEGNVPRIVEIEDIDFKPMHVDEAIMQMDLVDNMFLVFTNAQTKQVNVIYRRKDGNYGLIKPSP